MISIPRHSGTDPLDDMASALGDAGCLVVTGLADQPARSRLVAELAAHLEAAPVKTTRSSCVLSRAHSTSDGTRGPIRSGPRNILHPTVTTICDHVLRPNAPDGYQLHVTAALNVAPGARAQVLPPEEDPFTIFPLPRPHLVVATMWAITDFCAENGATLLVPESHRWTSDRQPTPDEILAAEMPAGSVLFWLGGTLHGAGANVSDEWRYGVVLTYSAAWLRQEENQYLDVPPDIAESLSPELQVMIGYKMSGALGFHDPRVRAKSRSPSAAVADA